MKKIYLNLKRFDIPKEYGGVNTIADPQEWGSFIVKNTQDKLIQYQSKAEFVMYMPEAHMINAVTAVNEKSPVKVGSQGVYREDTSQGGNFGAFTTNLTANATRSLKATHTIIGHFEERKDKRGILAEADVVDEKAVNRILNKEIKEAIASGLSVLYCVGETEEEHDDWKEVLKQQLETGLNGVDMDQVTIAYEPVWAIGPGKTPPGKETIQDVAIFIKEETDGLPVLYGGGLKEDNAAMLASIPEVDGGLIALTRFEGEIGFYPEEYLTIIEKYLESN